MSAEHATKTRRKAQEHEQDRRATDCCIRHGDTGLLLQQGLKVILHEYLSVPASERGKKFRNMLSCGDSECIR